MPSSTASQISQEDGKTRRGDSKHLLRSSRLERINNRQDTKRTKRAKDQIKSPLDEIAGIGAARKKALLLHFGSAKAVSRAGLTDLEAVPGISEAVAKRIYDHFHGG